MTKQKLVVLFSGGLDSTVLLWQLRALGEVGCALTIDYGQDAWRSEIFHADRLIERAGDVEHVVMDIARLYNRSNPGDVYPNRNMMLISVGLIVSMQRGFNGVAIGCNSSDYPTFADCSVPFLNTMHDAARAVGQRVYAPFGRVSKTQLVHRAMENREIFGLTWSCYLDGMVPCGECLSCRLLAEAEKQAGLRYP